MNYLCKLAICTDLKHDSDPEEIDAEITAALEGEEMEDDDDFEDDFIVQLNGGWVPSQTTSQVTRQVKKKFSTLLCY